MRAAPTVAAMMERTGAFPAFWTFFALRCLRLRFLFMCLGSDDSDEVLLTLKRTRSSFGCLLFLKSGRIPSQKRELRRSETNAPHFQRQIFLKPPRPANNPQAPQPLELRELRRIQRPIRHQKDPCLIIRNPYAIISFLAPNPRSHQPSERIADLHRNPPPSQALLPHGHPRNPPPPSPNAGHPSRKRPIPPWNLLLCLTSTAERPIPPAPQRKHTRHEPQTLPDQDQQGAPP